MSNVAIKQLGLVSAITDIVASGPVVLAGALRIEQHRALTIAQTTPTIALTLPAPVDASVIFGLQVSNIGSAPFTMYGVTLSPDNSATYYWNGAAWSPDASPQAGGVLVEHLVPTAANVIPSLSTAPRVGTPINVFLNGVLAPAGFSVSVLGAVTVAPLILGVNVAETDVVSVEFHV